MVVIVTRVAIVVTALTAHHVILLVASVHLVLDELGDVRQSEVLLTNPTRQEVR